MSRGLEQLAAAERAASQAAWNLNRELQDAICAARAPHIKAAADAEAAVRASYVERVREASEAHREATKAHDAAKIAAAEAGEGLPHPLGTILCEWEDAARYSLRRDLMRLSGQRARLEVFKDGDDFPSKRGTYSRPSPGTIVLRLLKKDGTPGIVVKTLQSYMIDSWLPEGVRHPNAPKQVAEVQS